LFTEKYPALPGVIMMASLFLLFVVELWLNEKTGGHSHGGATGEDFGGNGTSADVQAAFDQPIKRSNSYDSEMTMAIRDDKKGWVETS
jgi:zinc transporter 1/2/3